ncbi:MAG: hypothetical protein RIR51_1866, partial [Bacteroidota bacterium]
MKFNLRIILAVAVLGISSCSKEDKGYDASGSFEAEEIMISSEANGKIEELNIEEGQVLQIGDTLGKVESIQLQLKLKQLEAQLSAILSKKPDIQKQIASLDEQIKNLESEKIRFKNLVASGAGNQKAVDDIQAKIILIEKNKEALFSNLSISTTGIEKEANVVKTQIDQLKDQLNKTNIINPIDGTVLVKYAYENEITSFGKPLYKIAKLDEIILKVYVSGDQFSVIKLGQLVQIGTDDGSGGKKMVEGKISFISDKAEFTPKTIQTKNERANLVY